MPKKDSDPFSCFQLPDGRWRAVAQTRDQAGRLRPKPIERKTEKLAREAMRDYLRAAGRLNPTAGMSVAAMLEAYDARCVAKKRSANTLRKYRRYQKHWTETIGHVPVERLMPAQIEAALEEYEGGPDAISARAYLRAAINKVARKAAPTLGNAAALAEPPEYRAKAPVKLTESGLADVLRSEPDPTLRALWLVYAAVGIRPVEGRTLMWSEIEEREDGMWIRKIESKSEEGKRPVPVPKDVAQALRELPKTAMYLFHSRHTNRPFAESTVREYWIKAVERAGLPPGTNLYQLRHLFGTVTARRHKDHVLRRLMRHSSVQTSKQYYVDEFDSELRKAVDD